MFSVLITGGAGFIGSHLTELFLNKNYNVIVVDNFSTGKLSNFNSIKNNKNLEIHDIDILDLDNLKKIFVKIDFVIHLAGIAEIVPSIDNPSSYFDVNVRGTLNLLELSKNCNIKKFIYAASSSSYGIPKEYPTKENAIINPQYPYALTKYMGEELVINWNKIYKLPSISLRFFNVYGPKSRTSGTYGAVMGVFLAQKLANKPLTIVGDGTQTRDFTYVTDVCEAIFAACISKAEGEVINIGSENTYSINKLVKLIGGKTVNIPKRPGEPDCTWADITKAKKILKWSPKISFEEGISKLLENINYWKDAPIWDEKKIEAATKKWFEYLNDR